MEGSESGCGSGSPTQQKWKARVDSRNSGKEPKSYDREHAWSSINHTVLSAIDCCTVCRRVHHSEDRSDWQYCELCAKPFLFLSDLKAHLGRCQQGKSLAFRHQGLVLPQYLPTLRIRIHYIRIRRQHFQKSSETNPECGAQMVHSAKIMWNCLLF